MLVSFIKLISRAISLSAGVIIVFLWTETAGLAQTPSFRSADGIHGSLITANVIHRVFRIKYGQQAGTAFGIDLDGRQYLVTAKHLLARLLGKDHIEIFANGNWSKLPVELVGHAAEVDISVLATDRRLTPSGLPLEPTSEGLFYSQEVFFLGFPYDILSTYVFEGEGYPPPLVKKAIVSSFVSRNVFLLDGHNNPGFSGGPVVFTVSGKTDFKVAGIVSGYQAVNEPIFAGDQKTPLSYRYNTGIIVVSFIHQATALIRKNPIGFKLY
jgi:S1-C subfamily serine protease